MKLFQSVLLGLLLTSFAFTQTPDDKPRASNFDEFANITNGDVKARLDSFFVGLMNAPSTQGLIINYGSGKEIVRRETLIRNHIKFRRFDAPRVTFINAGFSNEIRTEFWLVPQGAENPKLEPTAHKVEEFGSTGIEHIEAMLDSFFQGIEEFGKARIYFVNYGTARETTRRERLTQSFIKFRKYDSSNIRFVKLAGKSGINTAIWIVPENAEVPKF